MFSSFQILFHQSLSTSGGYHEYIGGYYEYIGGGGIMSTSGGYHDACGEYHEYIGGCSVHRGVFSTLGEGGVQYIGWISCCMWGDTMSTSGRYHEYIGGCSVHWGGTMSTSGISSVDRGMFSTLGFSIEI